MKLCSTNQQAQIELRLETLMRRYFNADRLAPLSEVIRNYVLDGGKRARPQLCIWTFNHACEVANHDLATIDAAMDIACGWELFHAFLLAHDDIIDEAGVRRQRPSLHRQLAALDGNTRKFGVDLGIVAGDLLFSAAMQLWHDLELPGDLYKRELQLFSRIASLTGFGQAIDIFQSHGELDDVDEAMLLREYHWKTAAYTFEGPMLSAAILAGVGPVAQGAISEYALALGQAYQLQNDLLDLHRPADEGCDLVQGKRTISLMRTRAAMPQAVRASFDRRLKQIKGANGHAVALAEEIRQELCDAGAVEQTTSLIDDFLRAAHAAANEPAVPARLSTAMGQMLTLLREQYFTLTSRG